MARWFTLTKMADNKTTENVAKEGAFSTPVYNLIYTGRDKPRLI
jgi:hypothetical protein